MSPVGLENEGEIRDRSGKILESFIFTIIIREFKVDQMRQRTAS